MQDVNLTILSIAYPFAPVSCDSIGGAEQIIASLDQFLTRAHHKSIVLAHHKSVIAGRLIPVTVGQSTINDSFKDHIYNEYRSSIQDVLHNQSIDLVHMHGIDFYEYLPLTNRTILVTLHLPISWYPKSAFDQIPGNLYYNCVSATQQSSCNGIHKLIPFIRNGIPVERFKVSRAKKGYCLCLGRVCEEKAFHLAIEAVNQTHHSLIIAGQVFDYPEHVNYFRQHILPGLHEPKIQFIGPVDFMTKREILANAHCLLVTSQVDETSSLVTMEALASGTPVIAYPRGALKELIEDGRTGFFVHSPEEMAEAITNINELNPDNCRSFAEENFNSREMAQQYCDAYRSIIDKNNTASHGKYSGSWPKNIREEKGQTVKSLGDGISVELVDTIEQLKDLSNEWITLVEKAGASTPFQFPEWLITWWSFFHPGKLRTLVARKGETLIGIAPLYIEDSGKLLFLGTGISDYLDIIAEKEAELEFLQHLFTFLYQIRNQWEIAEFLDLQLGASLLRAEIPPFFTKSISSTYLTPYIPLPEQFDVYWKSLEAKQRRRLRRAERFLNNLGDARFLIADEGNIDDLLSGFFKLHQKSWKMRDQKGALASNSIKQYHENMARSLLCRKKLGLYGLTLNNNLISAIYGFFHNDTFYSYLGGFEPEMARFSPGTLILEYVIKNCIENGFEKFDFLRGNENYKYNWGSKNRINYMLRLTHA